ncbi:unnamed protein product [Schistocephalus solidus]|uniref:Transmembrane emp24 domain-containing protein 6 n=1 Tax=Schistocephalus solidus TaxID=70667 RepID=A0A183SD67_SCHSO|nr:unnamed protein product [Schistocephalus solidus]
MAGSTEPRHRLQPLPTALRLLLLLLLLLPLSSLPCFRTLACQTGKIAVLMDPTQETLTVHAERSKAAEGLVVGFPPGYPTDSIHPRQQNQYTLL